MKTITYTGKEKYSPPVEVAPARELSLPQGVACQVDDDHTAALIEAHPSLFKTGGPEQTKAAADKTEAKP